MAEIDWGNTRTPMHPEQMGNGARFGAEQSGYGAGYSNPAQAVSYGAQGYHGANQMQDQAYGQGGQMSPHAHGYPHPDPAGYPSQSQAHFTAPYPGQGPDQGASAQNGYAPMHGYMPPADGETPPRFGAIANYAGAAISLALVAGLAVWGYQLAVRDVSGIPVVRALEGPMRVQPVDPGGQAAAHQGFAVNAVQASGEASAPSDRVALAPAPDLLDEDDLPADPSAVATQPAVEPTLEPIEVVAESSLPSESDTVIDIGTLPVDPVAAALAIAEQISRNTQPLSEAGEEVTRVSAPSPSVAPLIAGPKVIAVSVPGVRQSPRPLMRPASLPTVAPLPVALSSPAAATTAEVTPDAIAAGTRLVQLGAFDSEDVARAEWSKLSDRFEDYIPGKTRVIQKAKSGGKTFYRLRAMGFKDLADARRFCSALMAGKAACIPVVTR